MERALFHMDNSYKIPNIRGTGRMCKTNLPSNTAFRGFGGPQGMLIAEYWMSEVAVTCGLPAEEVSWEVGGLSQSGLAYFGARGNFYLGHLPWGQRISMCHWGGWKLNLRLPPTPSSFLPPQALRISLLGKVRRKNMYKEGDLTHFNQKLEGFTLPRCWDECLASSQYYARRSEVDKFNK
jgi:hypothetical protein